MVLEKETLESRMEEIRKATKEILTLESSSENITQIRNKLKSLISLVSKMARPNEKEFIISEVMKSGYPLENYVQWVLASKGWHVQPNIYYPDKETNAGRELDIKAYKTTIVSTSTDFYLNLFIQCKKIPGNVWVFFQSPEAELFCPNILRVSINDFLGDDKYLYQSIFKEKGTHFDKAQALVASHCEIIVDKNLTNRQTNNLWDCQMTLMKAVSQEIEKYSGYLKENLDKLADSNIQNRFPDDLIEVFYPIVIFDGKMYEAQFANGKLNLDGQIELQPRDYVRLHFDYHSTHYNGNYFIDIVSKDKLESYLNILENDLGLFDERRKEIKGYEELLKKNIQDYCHKKINEKSIF